MHENSKKEQKIWTTLVYIEVNFPSAGWISFDESRTDESLRVASSPRVGSDWTTERVSGPASSVAVVVAAVVLRRWPREQRRGRHDRVDTWLR